MDYKNNRTLESAMWVFDEWDFDTDELFDVATTITDLIECIKKQPDQLIAALAWRRDCMQETMIEHDICPECGERLEWVRDGYNYVPYGSTYVAESSYGHKECSCGFRIDN